MRTRAAILALVVLAAPTFSVAVAETSSRSSGNGALLGSAECRPSPTRPVGWRGDWTGRYPGAVPPLTWSRRVKGFDTIRYQAQKPRSDTPNDDAKQLEFWTIKDWLVAGPFDVADPAKDIDKDLLNGEATVQPNEGDRAGTARPAARGSTASRWRSTRTATGRETRRSNSRGDGTGS